MPCSSPLQGGMVPLLAICAWAMVISFLKCGNATEMGRGVMYVKMWMNSLIADQYFVPLAMLPR